MMSATGRIGNGVLGSIVAGLLTAIAAGASSSATAAELYASAAMGTPAYFGGPSVYDQQFVGARFQLTTGAIVDHVGGHFFAASGGNGQVFGALVRLTSLSDVPDSTNLSTPDVLTHVTFTPPVSSADVSVPITPLGVSPGYYAIVFGSGLFGATGAGGAPDDNTPIGSPVTLAYHSGFGWDNGPNQGMRFTVSGTVPEPSTVACGVAGTVSMLGRRRRRIATR